MALLPVAEALARILRSAKMLPVENIALEQAWGRVTVADIVAKRDQPPFSASAMDGYALRHEDIASAPVVLNLAGVSAAGHAFGRALKTGQAVRIFTGAPLPVGADTVVIQENCEAGDGVVRVREAPEAGRNIRARALDFAKGDLLVPAGARLNARDIGLAASGNVPIIRVRRKPRVAVLTTGDELVLPGQKPGKAQIVSSNNHALAAFAQGLGAEIVNLGIVADRLPAIVAAIKKAASADVLITTGGASVGDHDFVQEALARAGVKINFWKIAMRPGKPFMFGTRGRQLVMGLPGNPVAALVCAELFLKPALAALQGVAPAAPPVLARVTRALGGNDQRQDYLRATLTLHPDGTRSATPAPKQDSSMQRVMREAQCLIIRPPHAPPAKAGDVLPILLLDSGS